MEGYCRHPYASGHGSHLGRAPGGGKGSDSAGKWWLSQQSPSPSGCAMPGKRRVEDTLKLSGLSCLKVRIAVYCNRGHQFVWGGRAWKPGQGLGSSALDMAFPNVCQTREPNRSEEQAVGCLEFKRRISEDGRWFPPHTGGLTVKRKHEIIMEVNAEVCGYYKISLKSKINRLYMELVTFVCNQKSYQAIWLICHNCWFSQFKHKST